MKSRRESFKSEKINEAREEEICLLDENIQEKTNEQKKRENQFRLKQDVEAKDVGVKRKSPKLKRKNLRKRGRA